jgi:hypothetical protein
MEGETAQHGAEAKKVDVAGRWGIAIVPLLVKKLAHSAVNQEIIHEALESPRIVVAAKSQHPSEAEKYLTDIGIVLQGVAIQQRFDVRFKSALMWRKRDRKLHDFVEVRHSAYSVVGNVEVILIPLL